jgi:hypothetical protein
MIRAESLNQAPAGGGLCSFNFNLQRQLSARLWTAACCRWSVDWKPSLVLARVVVVIDLVSSSIVFACGEGGAVKAH